MPNPFTTPIGPEGAAICAGGCWEVEPDTTPVELMCSMLGIALQAQLDSLADDDESLLLALTGDDSLASTVLTALFQSLAEDVTKAIDAAVEAWLPDPDVMARASVPPRVNTAMPIDVETMLDPFAPPEGWDGSAPLQ